MGWDKKIGTGRDGTKRDRCLDTTLFSNISDVNEVKLVIYCKFTHLYSYNHMPVAKN